jgi:hypothetical protein
MGQGIGRESIEPDLERFILPWYELYRQCIRLLSISLYYNGLRIPNTHQSMSNNRLYGLFGELYELFGELYVISGDLYELFGELYELSGELYG